MKRLSKKKSRRKSKKCSKGYIKRNSYTRTTRSGKKISVKASCIRATSASGKKRSSIDKREILRKSREHEEVARTMGVPKCGKNEIMREGYKRKSYTKKNGSKVKRTIVPPTCINRITGETKGEKLFILEKDVLKKYGYMDIVNTSTENRHKALKKAIKNENPLSIFRRLNALYVLNMNRNKEFAEKLDEDKKWIKTTSEYLNRPTSKKDSKKKSKKNSKKKSKKN